MMTTAQNNIEQSDHKLKRSLSTPNKDIHNEIEIREKENENENSKKAMTIELNQGENVVIGPKDMSYESPQKAEQEEDDWNLKLPSIKSSSGNDNFRNSNSDQFANSENNKNDESVSVELLEKSPEMTVYISEKDLSPPNQANGDPDSHRKSRIESLREITHKMQNEDQENENFKANPLKLAESKQLFSEVCEGKENESLQRPNNLSQNEHLMKKFSLMKEPQGNIQEALRT